MLIEMAEGALEEAVRLRAILAIHDRCDGKVSDRIEDNADDMTDAEYEAVLDQIMLDRLAKRSDEERMKLLHPAPTDTIQ